MPDLLDVVKAGPLASYLQCRPIVCKHLTATGLSQFIPFISQAAARESLEHLQHLDLFQVLGFSFDLNSPPAMCHERTQGKLIRKLSQLRKTDILTRADRITATRLRSCGGTGSGDWLRFTAPEPSLTFSDSEFIFALRFRLGLATVPHDCRCKHRSKSTKAVCNVLMDRLGHHAITCKIGGGPTNILHKTMRSAIFKIVEDADFHGRMEVPIPEFMRLKRGSTEYEDAIMDIVAWSPMYGEFLLDVTVRHPLTFSYQPQASQIDGIANDMANRDKQARYPPQGGRAVVTASMNTPRQFHLR